jgi:hypothetical protein
MGKVTQELFDVVAVNIETGAQRIMDRNKTADNAEAFINFAVMRRGVDVEFYKAVPAGSVSDSAARPPRTED